MDEWEKDICIADDRINEIKDRCKTKKEELINKIDRFKKILDNILLDGIEQGDVHEKIMLFRNSFDNIDGELEEINKKLEEQIVNFLDDFEKADGDLY